MQQLMSLDTELSLGIQVEFNITLPLVIDVDVATFASATTCKST